NGQRIETTIDQLPFKILVNDIIVSNFNIEDLPDGSIEVGLLLNQIHSNSVSIEAINPFDFIHSVELNFLDSSNNGYSITGRNSRYAVAGISAFDFEYRIIGKDNEEFPVKADLIIGGSKQDKFRKNIIEKQGTVEVWVESYRKKSNVLQIISRPNI